MCGRFTIAATDQELEERFLAELMDTPHSPHYNIAPGITISTILLDEEPAIFQPLHWGMHPPWMKGKSRGLINVRAESALEKPFFQKMLLNRRCIIPATGFYEWKQTSDGKQPYFFGVKNLEPFAMAGLWSEEMVEGGGTRKAFAIVTTEANELVNEVHNRMPVILPRSAESKWLNKEIDDSELFALLAPLSASLMTSHKVSTRVNNPRNNDPSLVNSC